MHAAAPNAWDIAHGLPGGREIDCTKRRASRPIEYRK
jgi:hypothetical protein